jgi:hypothetical protein
MNKHRRYLGAMLVFGALVPLAQHGQAQTAAPAPAGVQLRSRDFGVDQGQDDPALRLDLDRDFGTDQGLVDPALRLDLASKGSAGTRARVRLFEALGDVAAARKALNAALASNAAEDETLWLQKYEMESRVGDSAAALDTLTHMLERFPSLSARERLANLQLALGRTKDAFATVKGAPGEPDERWLRLSALLAFETGDIEAERRIYEQLTKLDSAVPSDYQRLLELARDKASASRIALAAFDRFAAPEMLSAAIDIYAADGNETAQLALLARAERVASFVARADYWRTLITLHQRRAARAAERLHFAAAKRELAAAAALLGRASVRAPDPALYERLWNAQRAQALSLALASGDKDFTARAYADYKQKLSVPERIYVLTRLGRGLEALRAVRQALKRDDLTDSDREALEDDLRYLGRSLARYVRASSEAVDMDGLFALSGEATALYADPSWGLGGGASLSVFRPERGGQVITVEQRDLAARLQGRIEFGTLELGLGVRNEASPRPFGSLSIQLFGDEADGAAIGLHLNGSTMDTSRLRVFGVSDTIAFESTLPFTSNIYLTGRAAADMYRTRQERAYLGAGFTFDAGLGATIARLGKFGNVGTRLVTRLAPRFSHRPTDLPPQLANLIWLPRGTEWVGLGASLARGQLDRPPLVGRQFCYLLDAAAGGLWPASTIGFSAQVGLGVSILGADLLSVSARGSNVLGTTLWSGNIGYGLTFER